MVLRSIMKVKTEVIGFTCKSVHTKAFTGSRSAFRICSPVPLKSRSAEHRRFTEEALRRAAQVLRKHRQSARRCPRDKVATKHKVDDKLQQLFFLDNIIFDSWQKVADRLARSGSEMFFPYWIAVKNRLVDMH